MDFASTTTDKQNCVLISSDNKVPVHINCCIHSDENALCALSVGLAVKRPNTPLI
jgi:hypothetical protein